MIVTRDRAGLLIRTLERCHRAAGEVELELVVIDDGSSDDTALQLEKLASELPALVWRRSEKSGPGPARNLGVSLARNEVLLFLDDELAPARSDLFRIHAELHAEHPAVGVVILGEVAGDAAPDGQSGSTRLAGTTHLSLKRGLVADWPRDGFSSAFPSSAFGAAELVYRSSEGHAEPLHVIQRSDAVAVRHEAPALGERMSRKVDEGMMARIFSELHPAKDLLQKLGLSELDAALARRPSPRQEESLADYLSVIEGVKSWARLLEPRLEDGPPRWRDTLLQALFQLCYQQGYVLACANPEADLAGAYRLMLDELSDHTKVAIGAGLDDTLDAELRSTIEETLTLPRSSTIRDTFQRSRLRRWAQGKPLLRGLYRRLRSSS